jgi:hypothetical protein
MSGIVKYSPFNFIALLSENLSKILKMVNLLYKCKAKLAYFCEFFENIFTKGEFCYCYKCIYTIHL